LSASGFLTTGANSTIAGTGINIIGKLDVGSSLTVGSTFVGSSTVDCTSLGVTTAIIHDGDSDTKLTFGTDVINIEAGGVKLLTLEEGATDGVIVNEDSNDVNFRVESSNEGNMLLVDGGTDRVGIATSEPLRTLHVVGDIEISGTIFQSGSVFEGGGGGGGGSSTFVGLSDTPANFTSSAGKFLQVNSAADALEFVDGNGLLDITTTRFTGDGSTSGYALSETINKEQNLIVTVGGLVQTPVEDYTLVGGTGVFLDENVVSGAVVEVRKIAQNSFSQNDSVAEAFTGNGVVSGFGLSIAPLNADPANVLVALNGVLQQPTTSYVVDGLNVVFAPETVASGDIVDVRHTTLSKAQPNYHQDIFTGNGVVSGFSMGRTVSNILETTVFVNGLAQIPDTNYFVDGTGLTFVDGDIASGDLIMVRHVY
jgi:hypothetical protein